MGRFGAGFPEWLMTNLLDNLTSLRSFYGAAAAEGQCVVKRVYAP